MRDSFYFQGDKREQFADGQNAIYSPVVGVWLPSLKRSIKVAQIKWAIILCDVFGIPVSLLGIAVNLDNVKSAIIAVLAIAYLMCRMFYYVVQKKQAVREKELELWGKEQDKLDRIERKQKQGAA